MAKRKKTLKQKLLADSRRKTVIIDTPNSENTSQINNHVETKYVLKQTALNYGFTSTNSKNKLISGKDISTINYQYLRSDLQKTIFLTVFIIVAELTIKFLVKI